MRKRIRLKKLCEALGINVIWAETQKSLIIGSFGLHWEGWRHYLARHMWRFDWVFDRYFIYFSRDDRPSYSGFRWTFQVGPLVISHHYRGD